MERLPNGVQFRPLPRYGSPPTLRTGYVRVLVFCNSCRHQADADRYALVESGRGDGPLTELPFRCSQCGIDRTDFVVTSRDNPQPWWAARDGGPGTCGPPSPAGRRRWIVSSRIDTACTVRRRRQHRTPSRCLDMAASRVRCSAVTPLACVQQSVDQTLALATPKTSNCRSPQSSEGPARAKV